MSKRTAYEKNGAPVMFHNATAAAAAAAAAVATSPAYATVHTQPFPIPSQPLLPVSCLYPIHFSWSRCNRFLFFSVYFPLIGQNTLPRY